MTPVYSDAWLDIYGGDCRAVLAALPAESVHAVVTSPPYWGLRDYGTATWEGGEAGHEHEGRDRPDATANVRSGDCACGARRVDAQLGLEATVEEYVANLVDVFRQIRRVLRRDGTVWLNLGDSHAAKSRGTDRGWDKSRLSNPGTLQKAQAAALRELPERHRGKADGLKEKDLAGVPWRVAFALQADGWYLRADVIWSKPNPMPESVTDRPTKSHEYVFLLAKSARYYYDADAIAEPSNTTRAELLEFGDRIDVGYPGHVDDRRRRRSSVPRGGFNGKTEALPGREAFRAVTETRNKRSVWTVPTTPYPGAHFAVFPMALVEPCILASTSERGACATCGAPWRRQTDRIGTGHANHNTGKTADKRAQGLRTAAGTYDRPSPIVTTTGWRPGCTHEGEPVPAVVLDPFAGSGTVGVVAQRYGRRAVLIDLNPSYVRQAVRRASRHFGVGGPELADAGEPTYPDGSLWLAESTEATA